MPNELLNVLRSTEPLVARQVAIDHFWHQRRDEGIIIEGADLGGADLSNLRLPGIRFVNCDLRSARAIGSGLLELKNCRLDGFRAQWAKCHIIRDCDVCGASLRFSILGFVSGCRFIDTDLAGVVLHNAIETPSRFENCDMTNFDVAGAQLIGCSFSGSCLQRSRLSRTVLCSCDFHNTSLDECNLVASDTSGTQWAGATVQRCCFLPAQAHDVSIATGSTFVDRPPAPAVSLLVAAMFQSTPNEAQWQCVHPDGRRETVRMSCWPDSAELTIVACCGGDLIRSYTCRRNDASAAFRNLGCDYADWFVPLDTIQLRVSVDQTESIEDRQGAAIALLRNTLNDVFVATDNLQHVPRSTW